MLMCTLSLHNHTALIEKRPTESVSSWDGRLYIQHCERLLHYTIQYILCQTTKTENSYIYETAWRWRYIYLSILDNTTQHISPLKYCVLCKTSNSIAYLIGTMKSPSGLTNHGISPGKSEKNYITSIRFICNYTYVLLQQRAIPIRKFIFLGRNYISVHRVSPSFSN